MRFENTAHRARTGLRPRPATATCMRCANGGMPRTPHAWHTARSAASHTCVAIQAVCTELKVELGTEPQCSFPRGRSPPRITQNPWFTCHLQTTNNNVGEGTLLLCNKGHRQHHTGLAEQQERDGRRTVHSWGHRRSSSERCARRAMRSAMQARRGLASRLCRPPNSSASAPACSWLSPEKRKNQQSATINQIGLERACMRAGRLCRSPNSSASATACSWLSPAETWGILLDGKRSSFSGA